MISSLKKNGAIKGFRFKVLQITPPSPDPSTSMLRLNL
jgi:hypothetical protein